MIPTNTVFVFGSNLAGRHGKGAALYAREHYGAEYGVGVGLTGSAYAIPTKDENLVPLELGEIYPHVRYFFKFARENPDMLFLVTAFGSGLAGYKLEQVKRLLPPVDSIPYNVVFMKEWIDPRA